jgi:methionyl-tRNA formyltransferase
MRPVIVFSPSKYSLYTICVSEMLRRNDIEIAAICVRNLVDFRRLRGELVRHGRGGVGRRILRKVLLKDRAYTKERFETFADYKRVNEIPFGSVSELARHHDIPVVKCRTLNDDHVVEMLKQVRPGLVVFTGGGIIRREVLENAGAGVVNCHMGILPLYRGLDVAEWPVLEGRTDMIGVTTHFMNEGIDTGPILRTRRVDLLPGDTFDKITYLLEPVTAAEIVEATVDFLQGKTQPQPQRGRDGTQHFVMHPRLLKIAEARLERFAASSDRQTHP